MGLRGPTAADQTKFSRIYPERPKPPRGLPKGARDLWKQIINSLPPDYFRKAELELFTAYVMAAHIYNEAMKEVQERGLVIEIGNQGYKVPNPALVICNKEAMLMSTLATKLRLCPNSRVSKWKANTPERKSDTRKGIMFGEDDE